MLQYAAALTATRMAGVSRRAELHRAEIDPKTASRHRTSFASISAAGEGSGSDLRDRDHALLVTINALPYSGLARTRAGQNQTCHDPTSTYEDGPGAFSLLTAWVAGRAEIDP